MLVKTHPLFRPTAARLWSDFAETQSELDRLFRFNFSPREEGIRGYYPPVNISENDDVYTVEARVPGLANENITVELEGRKLTIRGEHKREEANYTREERATGQFERTITFKHALAADAIEAEAKHGILKVTLPKAAEAKPRKINVVTK